MQIALVSRELYPYAGGGIAPIVAAAARELAEIAEVTVVTSSSGRHVHGDLAAKRDPRLLPDCVRLVLVEDPVERGGGACYSFMHLYSSRVHAALKDVYGDRGPDLIEFCDYLGEGLVTVQDRARRAAGSPNADRRPAAHDVRAVRRARRPAPRRLRDGRAPRRRAVRPRHADRILWSGGDVLATYQRYYGAGRARAGGEAARRVPARARADPAGSCPSRGDAAPLLYLGRAERRKGVQNLVRAVARIERGRLCAWRCSAATRHRPAGRCRCGRSSS